MSIDTIIADIRKVSVALEPIAALLGVVQAATGAGGATAATAIEVIQAAMRSFEAHAEGKIEVDKLLAEFEASKAKLAASDAAVKQKLDDAEKALEERFGAHEGG